MQKQLIILSLITLSVFAAVDFSTDKYQSQTRDLKYQQILSEVNKDTSSGKYPSAFELMGIYTEDMKVTMNYESDSMPKGRKKLIHSVGNTAGVQFVAEADTPYTGLFKGADSGIIRLSLAQDAKEEKTKAKEALDNFTPGFGLKFLIDGKSSANLVAMKGVNGVDTWNFFGRDFSNHIPTATGAVLLSVASKFSSASDHVTTVGIRKFAQYNQQGQETQRQVSFPWRLIFRAPDALKNQFSDDFTEHYQDQLLRIPVGTTLYDVYAIASPEIGCEKKIGSIILKTQLVPSKFGDEQLFFQHQKMENDLKLEPKSYVDYVSVWRSVFLNNDPKKTEKKCPYAN